MDALSLDTLMMAAIRKDGGALAKAVPQLIAMIRKLEAERDMWHNEYLATCKTASQFQQDVLDVTEEIMREFPGSKLTKSEARDG